MRKLMYLFAPAVAVSLFVGTYQTAWAGTEVVAEIAPEIVKPVEIEGQSLEVEPVTDLALSRDTVEVVVVDVVTWPTDSRKVSSGFGYRGYVCAGCNLTHEATDFESYVGAPVVAAVKGVVVSAQWNGTHGWEVVLGHVVDGQPVTTVYAHMQPEGVVSAGQKVKVGQLIGHVGMTGATTGAHLHFEVRYSGAAVNPYPWLVSKVNVDSWAWML